MHHRPFYRWRSFWLGLAIVCVIAGARVISINRATGVQLHTPAAGSIAVAQYNERAGIFYNGASSDGWGLLTDDQVNAVDPVYEKHWQKHSALNGVVVLGHSQILAVVLVVWTAFLALRWRKMRRSCVGGVG